MREMQVGGSVCMNISVVDVDQINALREMVGLRNQAPIEPSSPVCQPAVGWREMVALFVIIDSAVNALRIGSVLRRELLSVTISIWKMYVLIPTLIVQVVTPKVGATTKRSRKSSMWQADKNSFVHQTMHCDQLAGLDRT
jgi:hypothetical protein